MKNIFKTGPMTSLSIDRLLNLPPGTGHVPTAHGQGPSRVGHATMAMPNTASLTDNPVFYPLLQLTNHTEQGTWSKTARGCSPSRPISPMGNISSTWTIPQAPPTDSSIERPVFIPQATMPTDDYWE